MPLLPPTVVAPLSECSSSVRVEGQITGSTVEIHVTGTAGSIGGGVATWSDQAFPVAPGSLTPGHTVQALQKLGPDTSALGPGVSVQKKPPTIGPVVFQSHLYNCGRCAWLIGAVPGAKVEVKAGAALRGSVISADGNARLGLAPATNHPPDILTAIQTACGTPGVLTTGPTPDPAPGNAEKKLPPPTVPGPLKECDPAVLVTNVFEGATVTLKRTAAPPETACFDATGLWFILSKPLVLGEKVSASQAFPACKIQGASSPTITVGSAKPVAPPTVIPPLCAGQTTVTLTGFTPGALINIFQSGVDLGTAQAPDQVPFDFPVPALVGGTVITARQTLCKNQSVDSNAVPVDPAPAGMPTPKLPGPLFECASLVRVENIHIGAKVRVFSTLLGAEIGEKQAFTDPVDVPVAPLLIAGDHIFAVQIGCGHTSKKSAAVLVKPAPKLNVPKIKPPVDDCMTSVPVEAVVPGAFVDVYVNNLSRGSAPSAATTVNVPISGHLIAGDLVKARQRLCTHISGFSEPVKVGHSTARNWPVYHHDQRHSGLVSCSDINASNVATLTLKHTIPLDGHMISVPAIVDGKIYAGSSTSGGGSMFRIDLASGMIDLPKFSFVTPPGLGSEQGEGGVGCTPAVTGGKVYFSCLDGKVRCLDANTFALVWVTDLRNPDAAHNQPVANPGNAEGWSSPLVVNNKVYVGCGEGESNAWGFVYCLNAADGKVIWLFCTNQYTAGVDNTPNVVPSSSVGGAIPPGFVGFSVHADPLSRGSSVWSSCAYHAGLNRIYMGTGNSDPDSPLPNTLYGSGLLSLDADTGAFKGFFQPLPTDSYRANDSDVDVPCPPLIYHRPGQDVVAFAGKNGAAFLLDPATMAVLARRQLLPKDGGGNPLLNVDPHSGPGENLWGVFASPAVDPAFGHVYFGLGGYGGIDQATTPFLRVCDWATLADAWPTAVGPDTVTRYTTAAPPMYSSNEAGLSSPVVVNDVVLVSTSKPALYAFSTANGVPLWTASGLPAITDNPFSLGPAISGNFLVVGIQNHVLIYSL
jgi:outer membrane protein assembly factor BamB